MSATDAGSTPQMSGRIRAARLARRAAIPLFALLVWVVATWWMRGDLGWWSDDYGFNRRDPATGSWDLARINAVPPYFWRPLFCFMTVVLHNALWEHPGVLHTISALAHGATTALLFGLLRMLGVSVKAAAAGALLFLVYPGSWEVPLWTTALATCLASAAALLTAIGYVGYLRTRAGCIARGLWLVALTFGVFATPCLNEQPAAIVGAFPLLALAAHRPGQPFRVGRLAAPVVLGVAACLLYLALYYRFGPADNARGQPQSYVQLGAIAARLSTVTDQARECFLMRGMWRGALRQGWQELRGSSLPRTAILVLLAGTAAGFVAGWCMRGPDDPPPPSRPKTHLPARVAAAGVGIFLAAMFPVVLVRDQGMEPRLTYAPALGLAIVAAALLEVVLKRTAGPAAIGIWVRGAVAGAVAGAVLSGAVMMVGIQGAMRNRARMDQVQARALVAAVPSPAPGSVLIPLGVESRPVHTGEATFDAHFRGPMEISWAAPPYIAGAYRRADLSAVHWTSTGAARVCSARAEGLLYNEAALHPWDRPLGAFPESDGMRVLTWDRVIPFVIGAGGEIVLVDRVALEDGPEAGREFVVPQTRALCAARREHGAWASLRSEAAPGAPCVRVERR